MLSKKIYFQCFLDFQGLLIILVVLGFGLMVYIGGACLMMQGCVIINCNFFMDPIQYILYLLLDHPS